MPPSSEAADRSASVFHARLSEAQPPRDEGRHWSYVPYDQLTDRIGPLSRLDPGEAGIVLVESLEKGRRRAYHRQKIALILSNQRHFALEQARRGVAVRYVATRGGYSRALERVSAELGPLRMMEAAERELRSELEPLVRAGRIHVEPHAGWLTTEDDFRKATRGRKTWRMDAFYRHVRRRTGILMEDGEPVGGRLTFDTENRLAWKGDPAAPSPPRFPDDEIRREVARFVDRAFHDHPGRVDPATLPATAEDAARLWEWAKAECLESFGPFEDAMSLRSRGLFHTRISSVLNLHRLLPADVVRDAADHPAPLASREGFVRQVLGWREFVRHVHRATDGFRRLPGERSLNPLDAKRPLPPAWWGAPSGLRCLDEAVASVWDEGYSHHITRLMVLSNLAQLIDVGPRELTDWFWVAYTDAYDWVVEPNVLGMGTWAAGDLMITKPYVSGSAYIHRMSDYCGSCAFDPRRTCPITRLYWAFLDRHGEELRGNPRLAMPLRSLARRSAAERTRDRREFERVSETLSRGETLSPER